MSPPAAKTEQPAQMKREFPSIKKESSPPVMSPGTIKSEPSTHGNASPAKNVPLSTLDTKRKRQAAEFAIRHATTVASQLDQIDRDIAAAIARKSQITKEYQRVRGKIEDLQGKIAELEKSEANYPYQMQGADLEVDACRKRRSDLLDESDTWLETFHKSHEKKEALKLFDAHQEKRRR